MIKYIFPIAIATLLMTSCSKVDPTGVLIGHTSVDDRVKQSEYFYENDLNTKRSIIVNNEDEYSFLVAADSHTTTDMRRLREFFQKTVDEKCKFCAHLGDLAETQPEYYTEVKNLLVEFGFNKQYNLSDDGESVDDKTSINFFPVVGNHDVTRNGWALFTQIFGSSTYAIIVAKPSENFKASDVSSDAGDDMDIEKILMSLFDTSKTDMFIFLDTANGSLGKRQLEGSLPDFFEFRKKYNLRNVFVFTHNNFFRPRTNAFSANFPREELYYLLNSFSKNNVTAVFSGHIHKWDDRTYGGVRYLTLDALSEANSPESGMVYKVTVNTNTGAVRYECTSVK